MRSSRRHSASPYLGVDLTDRYSNSCRPIDVCGLDPTDKKKLQANFWLWHWDPAPSGVDVVPLVDELRAARAVMIDGPQGLAEPGATLRECERLCGCVGKTPATRPALTQPFGGFITSSLDLFAAFIRHGFAISPSNFVAGISEVYPGHIWGLLAGCVLPKKSTEAGRRARRTILDALNVIGLPELPSHDQNDACVAALLSAAADGKVPGLAVKALGNAVRLDAGHVLREGPMAIPVVDAVRRSAIASCLERTDIEDLIAVIVPTHREKRESPRSERNAMAEGLLDMFINSAMNGSPKVCTYAWAYRELFGSKYERWSQVFAQRVVTVAQQSTSRSIPVLGTVRLDTFIVAKKDRLPSGGHWASASYDPEEWERALGAAELLD